MQELDLLLLNYLQQQYPQADAITQQAFVELLQQSDDLLWDWLSGRVRCGDDSLQLLIDSIRGR